MSASKPAVSPVVDALHVEGWPFGTAIPYEVTLHVGARGRVMISSPTRCGPTATPSAMPLDACPFRMALADAKRELEAARRRVDDIEAALCINQEGPVNHV